MTWSKSSQCRVTRIVESNKSSRFFLRHFFAIDAIGKTRAACAQSFTLWQQATTEFMRRNHSIIACSRNVYKLYCCSSPTSRSWWITHSTQRHRRGCNNIPSFIQRTARIARSLCVCWTRHDLHILVAAPLWCDWKSPSCMCAKLHTVATSNTRVHAPQSLNYCLFAQCIGYIVVLRAHPVRGESHIQRNAIGEVATTSPLLYNESHVLCVKAELGMTFTSWSQQHFAAIGKARAACAQSFTMWHQATIEFMRRNHSRDHSIIACSCHVQYIYCCSSRTSRSWWITHSTQRHQRDCSTMKWRPTCYKIAPDKLENGAQHAMNGAW